MYNFLIFSVEQPYKGLKRFGSQRKLRCANWFPRNFHILLFRLTNLVLSQYARRLKPSSTFLKQGSLARFSVFRFPSFISQILAKKSDV